MKTAGLLLTAECSPFWLPAVFFVSGVAGLVYEVLWVRMIDKVIGSAPFSVATVISVVMGGLALGSYIAGRTIHRFPSRAAFLALYGKLELGQPIHCLECFLALAVLEV